jgi:16S rRNA (cytosine967-C5)-methyltransferase
MARPLVKPGGRIVYVTCSLLAEENEDQLAAFLADAPEFRIVPALEAIGQSGSVAPEAVERLQPVASPEGFLRLSPASSHTDGFFIAVLERAP